MMDASQLYEAIGYAASAVIAISLTMRSVVRLRAINLLGSAGLTSYGLLIGAFPVVLLNAIIIVINLYHLRPYLLPGRAHSALLGSTASSAGISNEPVKRGT